MSAIIDEPIGLALDNAGNLYVVEFIKRRIRAIDAATGEMSDTWSIADSESGSGIQPHGLAVDSQGNIYVFGDGTMENTPGHGVMALSSDGELRDSWMVEETQRSQPRRTFDIAIDSRDRVYTISESGMRVFDTGGEPIAEWSPERYIGQGSPDEVFGSALTIGVDDTISVVTYPGDPAGQTRVVRIDPDGEVLAEWTVDIVFVPRGNAGRFPASPGINGDGNLYIPDPERQRVLKLGPDGEVVGMIGSEAPGQFANLGSIAVDDDGNLYAIDATRERIVAFGPDGQLTTEFSLRNRGSPFQLMLDMPDITTGPDGSIFVSNPRTSSVLHFTPDGELIDEWGEFGFEREDQLMSPSSIAIDDQDRVYLTDESQSVKTYTVDGEYLGKLSESLRTYQMDMAHIAVVDGSAYVTTSTANGPVVARFDMEGNRTGTTLRVNRAQDTDGEVRGVPMSVTADADGNVYLPLLSPPGETGTNDNNRFVKVGPDGGILASADIGPRAGLVYSAIGPGGTLYVTDPLTEHILVYQPAQE